MELTVTQPTVELEVPSEVRLGDTVEVTLRLRNEGTEALSLELVGRPVAFDVFITGPGGREVWRRLHGKAVASALMLLQLGPGESREFTARWPQQDSQGRPVPPGRYTVQGTLPTGSRPLTSAPRDLLIAS